MYSVSNVLSGSVGTLPHTCQEWARLERYLKNFGRLGRYIRVANPGRRHFKKLLFYMVGKLLRPWVFGEVNAPIFFRLLALRQAGYALILNGYAVTANDKGHARVGLQIGELARIVERAKDKFQMISFRKRHQRRFGLIINGINRGNNAEKLRLQKIENGLLLSIHNYNYK
jgi:hypothetical protein